LIVMLASVSVQTALLPGTVRITGSSSIGGVRPLALNLPSTSIAERHQRNVEGPRAFVAVLGALAVVPRARTVRIGPGLRQFMPAHVRQRSQSLRVQARSVGWIATWISIQAEEERERHCSR